MTYGPVTVACGHPPCPRRMSWDFTTTFMANSLARGKGWLVKPGVVRCPLHVTYVRPRPPRNSTGRRRWDDATEQRIAAEYAEGIGTTTLGRKYGTAPTVIRRVVQRQGGTMRPQGTRDGRR